mgnify:CR=1 FL=1
MTGDSYTGFASVYDTFMDNVPYDEWAEYVTGILNDDVLVRMADLPVHLSGHHTYRGAHPPWRSHRIASYRREDYSHCR